MSHVDEFILYLEKSFKEYSNNHDSFILFHGRGLDLKNNFGFRDLSIHYYSPVVQILLYSELDVDSKIISSLKALFDQNDLTMVLQRRYLDQVSSEILHGELQESSFALENSLKFNITFKKNQNIGFFLDMKNGRDLIREISNEKNILNLFSYTCALSVCAIEGGAKSVVNFDMSSSALSTGRDNHRLNKQDLSKVKFFAHNIFKSYSKIKRFGKYDLIIVDPPSDQGTSFILRRDYPKILKRILEWEGDTCELVLCCNSPFETSDYLLELAQEYLPHYHLCKIYYGQGEFNKLDKEKGVKILHFKKL